MARASALTSNRSWCRLCSQATSSLPTTSGPTRSPASGGLSRPPGPPSGTCHPIARTSIPSSSASRSSRPSFAPHAVAAVRRSGRSLVPVSSASALTNAATIFGTAGTQPPHGHEKRSRRRAEELHRGDSGATTHGASTCQGVCDTRRHEQHEGESPQRCAHARCSPDGRTGDRWASG